MISELVIVLTAFLGNIFLGLFTYHKNPKSATNSLFFLFTLSVAAYLIFNHLALNQSKDQDTFFWIKNVMSIALLINLLFFLLVVTFPHPKLQLSKALLAASVISTSLLLPTTLLGLVFEGVIPQTTQPIPGVAMPLFLLQTLIFLGGGFVTLIYKLKKAVGVEKMQIKLFLLGTVLMFLSIIVTNLLFVIILKTTAFVGLLPAYTLIFLCCISYAIVKHKFLDITLLVARTVSFTLLTLLLGLIYALIFTLLSSLVIGINFSIRVIAIFSLLTLLMAFSFQPIRRVLEKVTDKILYKDKYDESKLLYDLALAMASTLRLKDLTYELINILTSQMRLSQGAFILTEKGNINDVIYKGKIKPIFEKIEISTLLSLQSMTIFDDLAEGDVKNSMRKEGFKVIMPLYTKGEDIDFLILGDKLSGDIYTPEDIRVLDILAKEAAVAIQNAKAYEEIRQFNITLQKEVDKATSDLKIANERLKELDQLKGDFVSIASHELRTPMTVIRSYAWMALHKSDMVLSPKLERYLVRILISTERVINLVSDLLNVSRIETGRVDVNPEEVDMISLVKDIVDEIYYSKSTNKNIQFTVLEQPLPKVFADPEKLRQVLLNLVGNAVKFTSSGGKITISFFTDGKTLEVYVKDTGCGISHEDLGRLFTKFGKLENSYVAMSTSGGTGLGLYICKNLVKLMHGKIWAESEGIDKGATFKFSLPVATEDILSRKDEFTIKPKDNIKEFEPMAI